MSLLVPIPLQAGVVFGLIIVILVPLVLFVFLWDVSKHVEQIANDTSRMKTDLGRIADELENREPRDEKRE